MERPKLSSLNLFGIGEGGFAIMMAMAVNYYAYFLTDVAKVGAATAGIILLLARIGDMVSVFIAGGAIEKITVKKWGKYRTWLLLAPPFTAALFILMFTNFGFDVALKSIFLGTCYVLAHFSVNLAWTSLAAMIPILGAHPDDRVKLSALRGQVSAAANILFGIIAMPMVLFFGSGNEAQGFLITVVVFALMQVFGYQMVQRAAKPFALALNTDAKTTISVKDMLTAIFTNKWLLLFFVVEVCILTARFMILSLAVYYFKYVAQNMLLVSVFFTVVSIGGLIGAFIGEIFGKKLPKKRVYVIGLTFELACFVVMWLVARNPYAFIALNGAVALGTGLANSVMYAVYADTADYGEYKTGKSAKGIIMAMSALPIKIAITIVGVIIGFSLAAAGYVADAAPSAALTNAIINIATLVPGFIAALALVGIFFYGLSEEKVENIKKELQAKTGNTVA